MISYLYHFAPSKYQSFYGFQVQAFNMVGHAFESFILAFLHWKYSAIVIASQCILLSILVWILPEVLALLQKCITCDYIYQSHHRYNLFVLILILILQQFSGIRIVINNIPEMMSGIGLNINNNLLNCLMNVIGFLTTFIAAFASVKLSRTLLWSISAFGLAVGLGIQLFL